MLIQPKYHFLLRRAGNIISVAGIFFVGLKLYEYGGDIDFSRFDSKEWVIIFGLALFYSLASPMLAFAWRNLLVFTGVHVTVTWAIRVYGISQIAKYVPGNIFHLAGRQALGMSKGVAAMPLFKSSAWELGLITGTGFIFGVLTLPALISSISSSIAFILFCVLCLVVFFCLLHVSYTLCRAFYWHLFFLLATGFIFIGLLYLVSDISEPLLFLCGSYVLAWVAGLITPGAPAGLGVRELLLLFLLKGLIPEVDLLLALILGRLVTVGGDIVFFLVASIVPEQSQINSTI